MAHQDDIALMAHLMRRAGFGATRDELETRVAKGYDATVEELLHPETQPPVDPYTLLRHQPAALLPGGQPPMGNVNYMYYLVNTKRPLRREDGAVLAPACSPPAIRRSTTTTSCWSRSSCSASSGMGNYRDLLVTIAKNPTMMFWLDNNQNHGTAVNENWGRELLELFSLGAGNYTEVDVREARAPSPAGPSRPSSRACPTAASRGSSSIARKTTTTARRRSSATRATSTARTSSTSSCSSRPARKFICRHLYNFFVADEPQVPAWSIEEPRDPEAIDDDDEGVPGVRSAR